MFRLVLIDAGGHVAGWLDDRRQFTTVLWEAAAFPNRGCALAVLRDTRRLLHMGAHCGWHLQQIEVVA